MAVFHYDLTMVVNSSGNPIGQGVIMRFQAASNGDQIPVTDYQGNSIQLVTSDLSVTPRFLAPVANGYLVDATGTLAQPISSVEAADALDKATEAAETAVAMSETKASLSGAAFTGPVTVPPATGPNHPVTKSQLDAAIASAPGGGTGGGGSVVVSDDPGDPYALIVTTTGTASIVQDPADPNALILTT